MLISVDPLISELIFLFGAVSFRGRREEMATASHPTHMSGSLPCDNPICFFNRVFCERSVTIYGPLGGGNCVLLRLSVVPYEQISLFASADPFLISYRRVR
jgi:hypothetical protein